jgi:hypothetical protein
MNLLKDLKPDVNVREAEYNRLLGYPYDYKLESKARELSEWAREWYDKNGKPWVYAVLLNKVEIKDNKVKVEDVKFSSKTISYQFSRTKAEKAVLTVISAGKECEEKALELWNENKPDKYFFLEIYGSAVVEHLVYGVGYYLCSWAEENNWAVLPHYSPGCSGWKIEDQNQLWNLIKNWKMDLPGEINLLESGMLKPKKSLLALFGITMHVHKARNFSEFIPCSSCSLNPCRYRRLPIKIRRTLTEEVNILSRRNISDEKYKFPGSI